MDRHELAWAAGFFDGEGSAWAQAQKGRRTAQPYAQINQADPDGIPVVLERFRRAVGVGSIHGPKKDPRRIDLYSWVASSRPDVTATLAALRPWLGSVKHNAFSSALAIQGRGRPAVIRISRSEELAWAAGLFDGEGSTCLLKHRTHDGYFYLEASITQSSKNGPPEVLVRFRDLMAAGRVYGPYPPRPPARLPVYRWKLYPRPAIERVVGAIWPWLGPIKRAQATAARDVIQAQRTLPRGNPAWGSHKTHCVHGHEYATARIRPFVTRGKNTSRRDSKQCLACLREYARRKRLEQERK